MLNEATLHRFLKKLAACRPIFHSEADFQHSLGLLLANEHNVRLEYCVGDEAKDRKYIDIWLPEEKVAIELKYCTKKIIHYIGEEGFYLKDQSAHDIRRYDFCKDIARIEKLIEAGVAKTGFALFLTNDQSYWNDANGRYVNVTTERRPQDYNFRIHENTKLAATLDWNGNPSKGTMGNRGPLNLQNNYLINWKMYTKLSNENRRSSTLKYTLQHISAR